MLTKLQRLANTARVDDSDGFTLIELLIVVVIIGILAAIAIPQFSSTKTQAYDATAKSDLRNLMTAQEAHYAQYQQYGDNITQAESSANSSTLVFSPSQGVGTDNITIEGNDLTQGFTASATHQSSENCFGVEVGDPDGDGTGGSGEVTADGGAC